MLPPEVSAGKGKACCGYLARYLAGRKGRGRVSHLSACRGTRWAPYMCTNGRKAALSVRVCVENDCPRSPRPLPPRWGVEDEREAY
eukprot:3368166-Rhodomonas_salina.4